MTHSSFLDAPQAVGQNIDLEHKPQNLSLQCYVRDHSFCFYTGLLRGQNAIGHKAVQRETKLSQVCPRILAECLQRMSVTGGLASDGHVVHSLVQGLSKYLWLGPRENQKTCRAMMESESRWDVANSKLSQLLLGESAAGKDNATNLILRLCTELRSSNRDILGKTLTQGNITVSGLIRQLKENNGYVAIINSEIEKIICKRRECYLQEGDLIEVLDGDEMGKANSKEDILCPRPHVWAVLGAQTAVYLKELSSDACARLRLQVTVVDDSPEKCPFSEKMKNHADSERFVVNVMKEIRDAQHMLPEDGRQEAAVSLRKRKRTALGTAFVLAGSREKWRKRHVKKRETNSCPHV